MAYSSVEAKSIQELCKIIDCEHKTAPYVERSDYLVVRTSNVRNGRMVMEDMKYTTLEGFKEWTQRAVPEVGDVLFTREAPAGEVCLVPKDKKVCMGQRMVMLRPNREKVDPLFLSLVLATEKSKFDILRLSIGSTVSRINIADIKKLRIAAPPLLEQRKVAQILSTWDKTIATTEKLLANSQQQKKSLIQKLLTGKNRFQEYNNEWSNYFLSQLFDFKKGKGLSKGTLASNGRKCILYGELYTRYGEVITHVVSRTAEKDGFTSKIGDILIPSSTTTTGIDLSNATAILEDQVLLGGDINVLRPKKKINSVFMAYLLTHIKKKDIASRAQGITIIHLYGSDLKTIKVFIPDSITEQEKIVTVLLTFDNEIEILKQKLHHLKQEKKALMQQLLTGKRRVKVDAA
ncbi:restriction endonuclease subunit S [Serratia marcescens]|uniref:restriction endonuclease subunit S n=1 Tax=Serratia marcescens TaxID=615 RepID=UPI0015D8459A|nr:restriction endonuclease subunit S [Serratia marcescens]QLJ63878.1 restriction endonuclease subunit S [Serratia marcescens]